MEKGLNKRAHVVLPFDLVVEIDKLVGKRGRSAFVAEIAQREIKIRSQREALREAAGAWMDKDHPELQQGAAAWIREVRALDSRRLEDLDRRREGE